MYANNKEDLNPEDYTKLIKIAIVAVTSRMERYCNEINSNRTRKSL
jgi:hypothetical protein